MKMEKEGGKTKRNKNKYESQKFYNSIKYEWVSLRGCANKTSVCARAGVREKNL